jgi:hypothetical protein
VDVRSVSESYERFASTVAQSGAATGGKTGTAFAQNRESVQRIAAVSDVAGLIGVEKDFWTAPDGTVYACTRMNRGESVTRYTALVAENDRVITALKQDAAARPATFDAYETLVFAASLAAVTDNFRAILAVLGAADRRPAYGSAADVNALAVASAHLITVAVKVRGDTTGRVAAAFSAALTSRGFRTDAPAPGYTLSADFTAEDRPGTGAAASYQFVYYTVKTAIANKVGTGVFAFTWNGNEGHPTAAGAAQRALRDAEEIIATGDFAKAFDAYLGSLL